jgi:hypothetical protein
MNTLRPLKCMPVSPVPSIKSTNVILKDVLLGAHGVSGPEVEKYTKRTVTIGGFYMKCR